MTTDLLVDVVTILLAWLVVGFLVWVMALRVLGLVFEPVRARASGRAGALHRRAGTRSVPLHSAFAPEPRIH